MALNSKKMLRRLYVVRHSEREDNINRQWQKKHPDMTRDNPPLSDRGRSQAEDMQKYFKDIAIDQIYVSPFDRTMETATILLGDHPNCIHVEPGMCEALYLCNKPPGFWPLQDLKKKFPRVNLEYQPVCPSPLPAEGLGDDSCVPRLRKTVHGILKKNPDSQNIVLVGHGASISAVHEVLISSFSYVGQATVSIFDELEPNSEQFGLVQSNGSSHLSADNCKNLRAY